MAGISIRCDRNRLCSAKNHSNVDADFEWGERPFWEGVDDEMDFMPIFHQVGKEHSFRHVEKCLLFLQKMGISEI